jgi:phytoene dehydrogenase-like protein
MTRVVVVGGGLAGLVAARHLADGGFDVELFERRSEVGGRVRTVHEDGFTFDRGFQVLFTAYPSARRELDYDALDLRAFAPGTTLARPGHRSTLADPRRDPRALVDTLLNPDVRRSDLVRLFRLERDLRSRGERELFDTSAGTIEEFLAERGFSRAFVENFAAPFYGGITLDRSLSTASGVFAYTLKMLTAGRTVVPADGMSAIPAQLRRAAESAGASVETGTAVDAMTASEGADAGGAGDGAVAVEAGGETLDVDAAVVATDPKTAGELTGAETPTGSRACVTQYYALDEPLGVGKRLVLNAADAMPNQVAPLSTAAPEYAPDGRELASATFLGERDEDDDELAAATRESLSSWFPERHVDPDLLRTDRVAFAQFDQPPGFRDDLPDVRDPGGPVYLAGDYTRWSSIHGAMESGGVAAEAVQADLK